MLKTNTMKLVSLATAFSLMSVVAYAEQPIDREMLKQYCTGDYLEHCSEFAPGGPEVEACFRMKAKQPSLNCSAAIAIYQQKQSGIRKVTSTR